MYLTVKEIHIAIDIRFKQLNSGRKKHFSPQFIDMCINRNIIKFVEQRTNNKTNFKKEGLEVSQKRYDDIRELLKDEVLPCYIHPVYTDSLVYAVLPKDYFKLISDRSRVIHSCSAITPTSTGTTTTYVALPFVDDTTTGAAASYYTNFKITINNALLSIPELANIELMESADAKFAIIHTVLKSINDTGVYNAYWERYDNIYAYNSFIITKGTSDLNVSSIFKIEYTRKDTTTFTTTPAVTDPQYIGRDLVTNGNNGQEANRPNELVTTERFWDMIGTYYDTKNRHLKPLSYLEGNRLIIHHNSDFIINNIPIQYIKQPTLVNLILNQSCELSKMEEIVELVALELYAIASGDYKVLINEQITNE